MFAGQQEDDQRIEESKKGTYFIHTFIFPSIVIHHSTISFIFVTPLL